MKTTIRTRPAAAPPVDEETRRIIEQRLATFDNTRRATLNVRAHQSGAADIRKAAAWYESQREGLGVTFIDSMLKLWTASR